MLQSTFLLYFFSGTNPAIRYNLLSQKPADFEIKGFPLLSGLGNRSTLKNYIVYQKNRLEF